jgi:hypothetical protein
MREKEKITAFLIVVIETDSGRIQNKKKGVNVNTINPEGRRVSQTTLTGGGKRVIIIVFFSSSSLLSL